MKNFYDFSNNCCQHQLPIKKINIFEDDTGEKLIKLMALIIS